jgi:hypothetical protein
MNGNKVITISETITPFMASKNANMYDGKNGKPILRIKNDPIRVKVSARNKKKSINGVIFADPNK